MIPGWKRFPGADSIDQRCTNSRKIQATFRWLAAVFFIIAGAMHFVRPVPYRQIIPPAFPMPALLVAISGVCEIAGGAGLLIPRLRRSASIGLILLLIAVFPANIYMALHPDAIPGLHVPSALLWLRLPMQFVLIAWVWWVG
jgi:uncharacterized membrane protein